MFFEKALAEIFQAEIWRQLPALANAIEVGDRVMAAESQGRIEGLRLAIDLINKQLANAKSSVE
jgi:hypothetical protein